ncbi:MAG: DUF4112 domain-containing protein [Sandaracinaceae bacterium]
MRLVRWLEDLVRIPGSRFGIGLDAVIGLLLPGAGDALTGAGSIGVLVYALRERVPTVILLRMVLNILVDTLGGSIPFLGDAFDVLWRSNTRNLRLVERFGGGKAEPSAVDYGIVAVGFGLAVLSAILPWILLYFLGAYLFFGLRGWLTGGGT